MDEREKKLKELEESLAKELDQEVNLTEPTDARLSGEVDLNPEIEVIKDDNIEVKGGSNKEEPVEIKKLDPSAKNEEAPKEVSLENLDEMLSDADGDQEILTDPEPSEDGEKETFDPRSMDQEILDELTRETRWESVKRRILDPLEQLLGPMDEIFSRAYDFFLEFKERVFTVSQWGIGLAKNMFNWFRKTLPQKLSLWIKTFKSFVQKRWWWFRDLPWQKKVSVLSILAIVLGLVAAYYFRGVFIIPEAKIANIRSFTDIESVKTIEPPKPLTSIEIAEDEFDHVVQLPKIAGNLKKSNGYRRPMAIMEVFVVVTTQEAAVEIRTREAEIRDYCARVLESYTYDEISRPIGQENLKDRIRRALNRVINDGLVKKVYFRDLTLKK